MAHALLALLNIAELVVALIQSYKEFSLTPVLELAIETLIQVCAAYLLVSQFKDWEKEKVFLVLEILGGIIAFKLML